jgi:hypothetical protein
MYILHSPILEMPAVYGTSTIFVNGKFFAKVVNDMMG